MARWRRCRVVTWLDHRRVFRTCVPSWGVRWIDAQDGTAYRISAPQVLLRAARIGSKGAVGSGRLRCLLIAKMFGHMLQKAGENVGDKSQTASLRPTLILVLLGNAVAIHRILDGGASGAHFEERRLCYELQSGHRRIRVGLCSDRGHLYWVAQARGGAQPC